MSRACQKVWRDVAGVCQEVWWEYVKGVSEGVAGVCQECVSGCGGYAGMCGSSTFLNCHIDTCIEQFSHRSDVHMMVERYPKYKYISVDPSTCFVQPKPHVAPSSKNYHYHLP